MARRKPRRTLLKIRVVPLVRMPKSRLFTLIKQACETGIIPDDIELQTLNWDHGTGGSYRRGYSLSARDRENLRNCYEFLTGAVGKSSIRVEHPR